jgi:anti-anti-sigma factor
MVEGSGDGGFSLEGAVLRCPRDLNSHSPAELRGWCERLLAAGPGELVVDLSETRFVASHHLGVISEAWSAALGAGRELVVRISPELRRVFELSGFDRVFEVVE